MENIRTDLAFEINNEQRLIEEDGVTEENLQVNDVNVKRIKISTEAASKKLGKPQGNYISVEFDGIFGDEEFFDKVCQTVTDEFNSIYSFENKQALIIGLGNASLTADALGPKTTDKIIASRHLKNHSPELFNNLRLGNVASLTTSVLGKTGIESSELVRATVDRIKPDVIIVIDALAAREMKRLCTTLQITDTGICPGSGVGNNREELTKSTLGVDVISIGIPTVVNARTLAYDLARQNGCEPSRDALSPYDENLIVTPKDIDVLVQKCASLLSVSINKTLHRYLSKEEIILLAE